jgi:hypothetical protein
MKVPSGLEDCYTIKAIHCLTFHKPLAFFLFFCFEAHILIRLRNVAVKFKTYLKNKEMRQEQVLTVARTQ